MNAVAATGQAPTAPPTPAAYYRHTNQQRFTIELEFLSSLSSPAYLTHLHAMGHFHSPSFLRYLAYLHQTWSQPRYIKYLRYPNAILLCKALVDSPTFRETIGRDGWEAEMTKQIVRQWAGSQAAQSSAIPAAAGPMERQNSGGEESVHEPATGIKREEQT